MSFSNSIPRGRLLLLILSMGLASSAVAQDAGRRSIVPSPLQVQPGRPLLAAQPRPPYRVAQQTSPAGSRSGLVLGEPRPNEHPLMPAVRWAREGVHNAQQIQDYSAVMVKREHIEGELRDEEYMFVKVRHKPMSVYMYFLKPEGLQGQEVMWIEGQNDGKMWAHSTGLKSLFGTVSLNPTGTFAMDGNRYPITEIGILNLVKRLLVAAEQDAQYGECEVKFLTGAKINKRPCTCIQVMHPVPRSNFLFYVARIFVDDEFNLPIRYEAYDWPKQPGESPQLIEQYTYLDLKLNNGFTDADFDVRNPQYGF
ncbi:MAG: DUF1571 domain-containing protein [Planctomycetes bacterium]|nr:DUF1571 domain-containing protein [Planctomycetota bacterium]